MEQQNSIRVENPIGLARELEAERRKNKLLIAALENERLAREKAEAALQQSRLAYYSDGSSTDGGDGANLDESGTRDESPAAARTREIRLLTKLDIIKREKEVTEAALLEMKKKVEVMQSERERTAQKVEEEEDMLSNTLLRKLRLVTREKDTLELQLSRSSRSSSLDHSCDSGSVSVAGSLASEQQSVREADTRSELSSMSNLACCSEMSDDLHGHRKKKEKLPAPPTLVGEK